MLRLVPGTNISCQFLACKKSKASSALEHIIKLIVDWQKNNIPILLISKNQTYAEYFKQVLEDLGINTSLVGAPFFIYLLIRQRTTEVVQ